MLSCEVMDDKEHVERLLMSGVVTDDPLDAVLVFAIRDQTISRIATV